MDNPAEINPLSAASLYIELLFNNIRLACGTAFYFKRDKKTYLVSNWHNFSGRHPETKAPLHSSCAIPNKVIVYGHSESNLAEPELHTFELQDDDFCNIWFQHPSFQSKVDVAVLPVSVAGRHLYDIDSAVYDVDPFEDWPLEIGDSLFILGFPFGIDGSHGFPLWKSAVLSSEPQIDQHDLPLMLVDTASRQGMSGSPVVLLRKRAVTLFDSGKVSRSHATFVGVYSGRLTPKDDLDAQLGKVWKKECIEQIIDAKICAVI